MRRTPFLLFLALAAFFTVVVAVVSRPDRPPAGDEKHYLRTLHESFAGPITIETLRDYNEVIAPFPFVVYGQVGRVVGLDPWKLRVVSLALAFAAALIFYAAVDLATRRPWVAFAAAAVVMTSPYMVRMSAVVYTDMLPLTLLAAWLWFMVRGWAWPAGVCAALMLLSRQYYAFVPLAAGAFFVGKAALRSESRWQALSAGATQFAAVIPFALFVALWGGLAPPRGRAWIPPGEPFYHPGHFTVYIVSAAVYAAPLLAWRRRAIYGSWRIWAVTAPCLAWCLLFPAAIAPINHQADAVGMFHRFVQIISFGHPMFEQAMLLGVFALGVPVILWLIRDSWRRLRSRDFELPLLLDLALLAFFVIMPASFNVWEKYLLPALMMLCMRLAMGEETAETDFRS